MPSGSRGAPACPFFPSQPLADPQHPSARRRGAARRDPLLSPCSPESGDFRFLLDMLRIGGEHLESPCSLCTSPGRTDTRSEPGSLCSAPSPARHNACSPPPTVTSRLPPPGRSGSQAPKQHGGVPGQPVPVRPHPQQNQHLPPNTQPVSPLFFPYYASPPEDPVPSFLRCTGSPRKVKAPISFPSALSMPPSLERDPRCLSSLPTKSRLVAPLYHCQSNQVTKFPVSDLQAY